MDRVERRLEGPEISYICMRAGFPAWQQFNQRANFINPSAIRYLSAVPQERGTRADAKDRGAGRRGEGRRREIERREDGEYGEGLEPWEGGRKDVSAGTISLMPVVRPRSYLRVRGRRHNHPSILYRARLPISLFFYRAFICRLV